MMRPDRCEVRTPECSLAWPWLVRWFRFTLNAHPDGCRCIKPATHKANHVCAHGVKWEKEGGTDNANEATV